MVRTTIGNHVKYINKLIAWEFRIIPSNFDAILKYDETGTDAVQFTFTNG